VVESRWEEVRRGGVQALTTLIKVTFCGGDGVWCVCVHHCFGEAGNGSEPSFLDGVYEGGGNGATESRVEEADKISVGGEMSDAVDLCGRNGVR